MAIEYGIYCMLFEKLIPRHIHTQSEVRAEVTYQSVDDVKRVLEKAGMPIKQIEVLILRASLGERRVMAMCFQTTCRRCRSRNHLGSTAQCVLDVTILTRIIICATLSFVPIHLRHT